MLLESWQKNKEVLFVFPYEFDRLDYLGGLYLGSGALQG